MDGQKKNVSPVLIVAAIAGLALAYGGYYMYTTYIAPLSVGNESLRPFPEEEPGPRSDSAGAIELPR